MKLSHEQVRFFRQSGYIKLKEKIPESLLEDIKKIVLLQFSKRIEPFRLDSLGRVARIDELIKRDPIFYEIFSSPTILDPLESILGPNLELTLNRHNHATLNLKDSNRARLHRDVLQWSRSLVTAIIYLDDATTETGCTYIIPGSHYLPFVGTPNNGGTWMDEHSVYAPLIDQAIPVPMERGSILLFDSLAFHTAGENKTDTSRMSLCVGYHSVDELIDPSVVNEKTILVRGERLYRGNDAF